MVKIIFQIKRKILLVIVRKIRNFKIFPFKILEIFKICILKLEPWFNNIADNLLIWLKIKVNRASYSF